MDPSYKLPPDPAVPIHPWSHLQTPSSASLSAIDSQLPSIPASSPANIQFTSGTTGRPKGATLTHHNILNNGLSIGERTGYSEADRICLAVPLYHCFGMVMGNLAALVRGMQVVYPGRGFSAARALEACERYGATSIYGVPTMFIEYIKEAQKKQYDLKLRTGIMAGSLCP
jgi:fatty-acyl-CoA synthase